VYFWVLGAGPLRMAKFRLGIQFPAQRCPALRFLCLSSHRLPVHHFFEIHNGSGDRNIEIQRWADGPGGAPRNTLATGCRFRGTEFLAVVRLLRAAEAHSEE
jgi:hypothetical protein